MVLMYVNNLSVLDKQQPACTTGRKLKNTNNEIVGERNLLTETSTPPVDLLTHYKGIEFSRFPKYEH